MAVSMTLLDEHVLGKDSYTALADVPVSPHSRRPDELGVEHMWSLQPALNGCRQRANASTRPVLNRRSAHGAGSRGVVSPHDELRLPFCAHWPLVWDSDSSAIFDRYRCLNKPMRGALFAEDVKLERPRHSKSRSSPSHPVVRSFGSWPAAGSFDLHTNFRIRARQDSIVDRFLSVLAIEVVPVIFGSRPTPGVLRRVGCKCPGFTAAPSVPVSATRVASEPLVGAETHQHRLEKYNAAWTKLTTERSSSACSSHPIHDLPMTATASSIIPWPTPSLSAAELTATSVPLAIRHSLARNSTGHSVVGDCHAAVIKYTVYQFLVSPFGFRPVALRDDGVFGTDGPVTISLVVDDDLSVPRHKERNDDGVGEYFGDDFDRYSDYVEDQHDYMSPRCTHSFQHHPRRRRDSLTPGLGSHPTTRPQRPVERDRRPKKAPDFQALKAQVKCDLKRWHPDRLLPLLSSMTSAANARSKSPSSSSPSRIRPRPSGAYQCSPHLSNFPSQECRSCPFDQPRHDDNDNDNDNDDCGGPLSCACDQPLQDSTSCQCPSAGPTLSSSCGPSPLQSTRRPKSDPAFTTISEAEKDLVKDVTQAIIDLFVEVRRLGPFFSS
ncbi:MAG: hypothetical protein M1815_004842 [Lichina confinis]|nr:MAG: hypothetical protein M1815_004842 [Lichina confinis]